MPELAPSWLRVDVHRVDVRDVCVEDDTRQRQVFAAKGGLAVNGHGFEAG